MPQVPSTARTTEIAILAFNGCMASAVVGLLDTFAIANQWAQAVGVAPAAGLSVRVLTLTSEPVTCSGGFTIPAAPLQTATPPDLVIVPPIMAPIDATLAANAALVQWLREAPASGRVVASVCTGAFFLAEAGLLAQRTATTNPAFAELFRRRYPQIALAIQHSLVDHGQVVCVGSTMAFLRLAVFLVDRFYGHEVAVLTAKSLAVDKNQQSQLPYFVQLPTPDHGYTEVAQLQEWMNRNYASPMTATDLAERAALSTRSLHRHFIQAIGMAPLTYLHRLRVEAAKRLLETTVLSLEQITERVGYQDARAFGRLFRKYTDLSPGSYRSRFGKQVARI